MPSLDRRITVRRSVADTNDFGEPTETVTDVQVWASVADLSAFDVESEGGTFSERLRKWTIRWRKDLATANTSEISVIEDGTLTYNVTNIVRQVQDAERKRTMVLEGIAVV